MREEMKTNRRWPNTAKFMLQSRLNAPGQPSQAKVATQIGYKCNGQFLSNCERALCGIPVKVILPFCKVTGANPHRFKAAILKDELEWLNLNIKENPLPENAQTF